ncbi:hypothetical protein SAMD00019534_031310, partial [Acytostelium subglobosum LB1]|uniref:hypothetical protein n=1 Tax=Acytostelium subglobosum LB1 TaxID=1410327 RepID=UPI000644FEE4
YYTKLGKSSLLNIFANFFLKGTFPKNLKVIIETAFFKVTEHQFKGKGSETNVKDQTKSQTSECSHYDFTKDGDDYLFIDTPGVSDTNGPKQDDENISKIIEAAENCESLSAIILVVNGTEDRNVTSLKNAISRLKGAIPDVILNNLILVFTKCEPHTATFQLGLLGHLRTKAIFYMNNSLFVKDPMTWNRVTCIPILKDFQTSLATTDLIMKCIRNKATVSTIEFGNMRKLKFKVQATLHQARLEVKRIQDLQDKILIAQAKLGDFQHNQNMFKDFNKTTEIINRRLVDSPDLSTICNVCTFACHSPCNLKEITVRGDNAFKKCYAMSGRDNCHVCPNGCSYQHHYHKHLKVEEYVTTVDEEIKEMKAKYMSAEAGYNQTTSEINSFKDAKVMIATAINVLTEEITTTCRDLKSICQGFNLVDELSNTIKQMEIEAKLLASNEARASADQMIRVVKGIADRLSNEAPSSPPPPQEYEEPVGDEEEVTMDHLQSLEELLGNSCQIQEPTSVQMAPCFKCHQPWSMPTVDHAHFEAEGYQIPIMCRPCR